jgi:hypothetical protein
MVMTFFLLSEISTPVEKEEPCESYEYMSKSAQSSYTKIFWTASCIERLGYEEGEPQC